MSGRKRETIGFGGADNYDYRSSNSSSYQTLSPNCDNANNSNGDNNTTNEKNMTKSNNKEYDHVNYYSMYNNYGNDSAAAADVATAKVKASAVPLPTSPTRTMARAAAVKTASKSPSSPKISSTSAAAAATSKFKSKYKYKSATKSKSKSKGSSSSPAETTKSNKPTTSKTKATTTKAAASSSEPSLEPYVGKLERFELFQTNQCYYLVGCNKLNTAYRVLKLDRTLIERPPDHNQNHSRARPHHSPHQQSSVSSTEPAHSTTTSITQQQQHESEQHQKPKNNRHGINNKTDNINQKLHQQYSSGATSIGIGSNPSINYHPHHPGSTPPPPPPAPGTTSSSNANTTGTTAASSMAADASHNPKPTLRPLSDFLTEDPHVYSQEEIKEMLDMIHDGNRTTNKRVFGRNSKTPKGKDSIGSSDVGASGDDGFGGTNDNNTNLGESGAAGSAASVGSTSGVTSGVGGGLKPIVRAYGIVGFIRFLDCYYLTLITRRAKVGSIGGNGIYTIKNTETFPIKPAERGSFSSSGNGYDNNNSGYSGSDPSSVLLSMWNRGKRSVGLGLTNREIAELRYQGLYQVIDLTKNFYFSYTYDITRSLQENFLSTAISKPIPPPPFKDMYAWNFFLTRELDHCTNSLTSYHWILPIIHGAYVQRKLNDYGRSLNLILIARRSRHFAGTRYLKRGVSEQGKVANDVEHEQIVHDESKSVSCGIFSSYLQVRGSIPTFWTQESSVTMPKPPIELNRVDPTYIATQYHFEDLLKRYGTPTVVLDLVKQSEKREREVRVGNEYRHAIDYINTSIYDDRHKIRYCALDYSHISKHRNLDVSTSLNEVSTWAVNQTGFFCSAPKWKILPQQRTQKHSGNPTKKNDASNHPIIIVPFDEKDSSSAALLTEQFGVPVFPMEQTGVLRTNCIDCLDRTNVAQFSAGVEAIEQQLVVMGIRSSTKLDPSSNIVRVLIDMYVDIGDSIALQYGGSEAHKKVSTEHRSDGKGGTTSGLNYNYNHGITGPMGKHKELLTSIRRYYSNAFTDRLKQDAMNLFLGYYVPYRHTIPLWEMESDYYLHNFHVKAGKGTLHSMKAYQRAFGIEWNDDLDRGNVAGAKVPGCKDIESSRIERVRNRCTKQKDSLSQWWKIAIQANIQQRMWMQLGRPNEVNSRSSGPSPHTSELSLLPPRFERLYQPDKIAQFDRFFARGWATPVRRSHSAQHSTTHTGNSSNSNSSNNHHHISSSNNNNRSNNNHDIDLSQTGPGGKRGVVVAVAAGETTSATTTTHSAATGRGGGGVISGNNYDDEFGAIKREFRPRQNRISSAVSSFRNSSINGNADRRGGSYYREQDTRDDGGYQQEQYKHQDIGMARGQAPLKTKSLKDFVTLYGLEPPVAPTLKSFINHHGRTEPQSSSACASSLSKKNKRSDQLYEATDTTAYIGRISSAGEKPREEYLRYVNPPDYFNDNYTNKDGTSNVSSNTPSGTLLYDQYRPEAVNEFNAYLRDCSLSADDVQGIRKLAESAHIGRTIRSGPYRGLMQDESAVEIATTIQEQFNALESMRSRSRNGDRELKEGFSLIDHELRRRGLHTSGVKEAVTMGWDRCIKAEKQYSEIVNPASGGTCSSRRSDLTTANSLQLYASVFDENSPLSIPDLIYLLGGKPTPDEYCVPSNHCDSDDYDNSRYGVDEAATAANNNKDNTQQQHSEGERDRQKQQQRSTTTNSTAFVEKAAKLGIPIISHSDINKGKAPPLFQFERRPITVPDGFEQINEDMFALKDNKFMVFNGAGVDSWKGTQPVTKMCKIEDILLSTMS